jgi:hypothetical protein
VDKVGTRPLCRFLRKILWHRTPRMKPNLTFE